MVNTSGKCTEQIMQIQASEHMVHCGNVSYNSHQTLMLTLKILQGENMSINFQLGLDITACCNINSASQTAGHLPVVHEGGTRNKNKTVLKKCGHFPSDINKLTFTEQTRGHSELHLQYSETLQGVTSTDHSISSYNVL